MIHHKVSLLNISGPHIQSSSPLPSVLYHLFSSKWDQQPFWWIFCSNQDINELDFWSSRGLQRYCRRIVEFQIYKIDNVDINKVFDDSMVIRSMLYVSISSRNQNCDMMGFSFSCLVNHRYIRDVCSCWVAELYWLHVIVVFPPTALEHQTDDQVDTGTSGSSSWQVRRRTQSSLHIFRGKGAEEVHGKGKV